MSGLSPPSNSAPSKRFVQIPQTPGQQKRNSLTLLSSSPLRNEVYTCSASQSHSITTTRTSNLLATSSPTLGPTPPKRIQPSPSNFRRKSFGLASRPELLSLPHMSSSLPHHREISSSAPIRPCLRTYGSFSSSTSISLVIPTIENLPTPLPKDKLAKLIDWHLVGNKGRERDSKSGCTRDDALFLADSADDADANSDDDGLDLELESPSYGLVGGFATRDVYKWKEQEEYSRKSHRRSKSETHLSIVDTPDNSSIHSTTAREIKQPGGFRRFFVKSKAEQEHREPPPITRTFIDFLALYGNFGGDWYWDQEEVDEWGDIESLSPIEEEVVLDEEKGLLAGERSPLLPGSPSNLQARRYPQIQGTASDRKAMLLLIKSFIGTGVLFLPSAFRDGGLTISTIVLILIAILTVHGMLLLFETHKIMPGSFGDIAEKSFGTRMRHLVLTSITLSQTGFCMAYFIFVAQNAQTLVLHLSNCQYNLPLYYFIILQLVLYIPLALVRKIKHFAITSIIGDVFILGGLCVISFYDADRIITMGIQNIEHVGQNIAVYLGTACYTFEGICLVLPIAQSMKKPHHFPRVLSITMFITTFIYIIIATLSYLSFGPELRTIVLQNLPATPISTATHIIYILAIMFTWPLVLFPATRILENAFFGGIGGKNDLWVKWQKNFFRAALVCMLALGAWGGSQNLSKFVSLIGAFACIPLSFIYPAIFHYKLVASNFRQKLFDLALFVFGMVSCIYVTYVTIISFGAPEMEGEEKCFPNLGT